MNHNRTTKPRRNRIATAGRAAAVTLAFSIAACSNNSSTPNTTATTQGPDRRTHTTSAISEQPGPGNPDTPDTTTDTGPGAENTTVIGTVRDQGGMCPKQTCATAYTFRANGVWEWTNGAESITGRYDPQPLLQAIRIHTDSSNVTGRPPGSCRSEVDGTDTSWAATDPATGATIMDVSSCDGTTGYDPEIHRVLYELIDTLVVT